jgi:hypothetical protein
MAIIRRLEASAIHFCSAGWQPAVSADWQSAERRIFEHAADCQSATQQTASLRYLGCDPHTASPTTGRLMAIIRRPAASAILFLVVRPFHQRMKGSN